MRFATPRLEDVDRITSAYERLKAVANTRAASQLAAASQGGNDDDERAAKRARPAPPTKFGVRCCGIDTSMEVITPIDDYLGLAFGRSRTRIWDGAFVLIADAKVSRHHAELFQLPGDAGFRLVDKSAAGTFVVTGGAEDRRVTRICNSSTGIRPGAVIKFELPYPCTFKLVQLDA